MGGERSDRPDLDLAGCLCLLCGEKTVGVRAPRPQGGLGVQASDDGGRSLGEGRGREKQSQPQWISWELPTGLVMVLQVPASPWPGQAKGCGGSDILGFGDVS